MGCKKFNLVIMPSSGGRASVRVYYVRHGQSVWNRDQNELRRKGASESEIRAMGQDRLYTDSPLSKEGVRQALELRRFLFPERIRYSAWPFYRKHGQDGHFSELPDSLASHIRCAMMGACPPPRLLASNLRRAIDTLLLALRPALEAPPFEKLGLLVVPALQETCSYSDCMPTARYKGGMMIEPLPGQMTERALAEVLERVDGEDKELVKAILLLQAQGLYDETVIELRLSSLPPMNEIIHKDLDYLSSFRRLVASHLGFWTSVPTPQVSVADHCTFLRNNYQKHVAIASGMTFDDRRRMPTGLMANWSATPHQLDEIRPFLQRVEDIMATVFDTTLFHPGDSTTASMRDTIIIGGHSRFLRELLFLFRSKQQITCRFQREGDALPTILEWASSNSRECLALSFEEWKLSNTGAVTFDLELCMPPTCGATILTLKGCKLDAGGRVYPRNGGEPFGTQDTVRLPFITTISTVMMAIPAFAFALPPIFLLCFGYFRMFKGDRSHSKREKSQ